MYISNRAKLLNAVISHRVENCICMHALAGELGSEELQDGYWHLESRVVTSGFILDSKALCSVYYSTAYNRYQPLCAGKTRGCPLFFTIRYIPYTGKRLVNHARVETNLAGPLDCSWTRAPV